MRRLGTMSAWGRRSVVALGVVATLGAASAHAQTPPAAAAPAQAPVDALKFTSESVGMLYIVKADKVADFELFWTTVRSKVAASDKADYKAMIDGVKIYKIAVEPQAINGVLSVTYLFIADKAATVTYDPTQLLYSSGIWERAGADELYPKLRDAITTLQPWPLTKVGG
jgi:hypothetical protein